MRNSILAVIAGAMLAGCGGADTADTKPLANEQALKVAGSTGTNGSTTCNTGDGWWSGPNTILNNLVVPAGATCRIAYYTVNGNTSIAGRLMTVGSTFIGNVTVDGGALTVQNWGSRFKGNVTMRNVSSGDNGFWLEQSEPWMPGAIFEKNFTYSGNSVPLYVQISRNPNQPSEAYVEVQGNLTYENSPCGPQLVVDGSSTISCY